MGRLDMGVRGERVQREGTPIRCEVDTVCLDNTYHRSNMAERNDFDKIELHLIRVLQTLITERSVSRAAMRLRSTQPAVSASSSGCARSPAIRCWCARATA